MSALDLFGVSGGSRSSVNPGPGQISSSSIFGSASPFGGQSQSSTAPAGNSLFGKPVVAEGGGLKFPSESGGGGLFKGGSGPGTGLFDSQYSIKRSAGTRPNTPVFEEAEESAVAPQFSVPDSSPDKTDRLFEPHSSMGPFGGPAKSGQGATARFLAEDSSQSQKLFSKPKINRGSALFGGKSATASAGGIFTSGSEDGSVKRSIRSRLGNAAVEEGAFGQPRPRPTQQANNPFVWTKAAAGRVEAQEASAQLFGGEPETGEEQEEYYEREYSEEPSEEREVSETESDMSEQSRGAAAVQSKSTVRRSVSKEELATITAIRCELVPDVLTEHQ